MALLGRALKRIILAPIVFLQKLRGRLAWRRRDWDTAIDAYANLRELGVAAPDVVASLGTAYAKARRWEDALAIFEAEADCGLRGEALASRWHNHALALHELARFDEASDLLIHSISHIPEGHSRSRAKILLASARIAPLGAFGPHADAKWQRIARELRGLQEDGFDTPQLRLWMGKAQLESGLLEDALGTFGSVEQAELQGDARANFIVNRAWALLRLGRFEESIEVLAGAEDSEWPDALKAHAVQILNAAREELNKSSL